MHIVILPQLNVDKVCFDNDSPNSMFVFQLIATSAEWAVEAGFYQLN